MQKKFSTSLYPIHEKDPVIEHLRERLKEEFRAHPEIDRAYLFGSLVGDAWDCYSDADILVILKPGMETPWQERWRFLPLTLDVPADVLVVSEAECAARRQAEDPAILSALEHGILLYSANPDDFPQSEGGVSGPWPREPLQTPRR